jgi:hypothetical protein
MCLSKWQKFRFLGCASDKQLDPFRSTRFALGGLPRIITLAAPSADDMIVAFRPSCTSCCTAPQGIVRTYLLA